MAIDDLINELDTWINAIDEYDFQQLCVKPSENSWSLGQVYMHLIAETTHYIAQIQICLSTNDNSHEEAFSHGKWMLQNNSFPDEIIEGPSTNALTLQPDSKEQLGSHLMKLKAEINNIGMLLQKNSYKGKTKHPGLNYFNANEWCQFAEMHFRHHLRQKKRLDEYLIINSYM